MNYEVVRRFRDKYTGEVYLPGHAFKCDEGDRIEDLLTRKLIEQNVTGYEAMTKREIQYILDEKDIPYAQRDTKERLIELLTGGD